MSENATEWFGMRVTPTQKEKIKRLAERRGTTQKAVVLEAVERKLAEDGAEEAQPESALEQIADLVDVEPEPGSVLALTQDLCGSIDDPDLPTDLSSNPKHMEDYGNGRPRVVTGCA